MTGTPGRGFAALTLLLAIFAAPASAEDALDKFVETLKAESAGVKDFEAEAADPKFTQNYPHPQLPRLAPADAGPRALDLMAGRLAGDPYADAYIRWHLQPLVNAYLEEAFRGWLTTGEHKLAPSVRQRLTDFYRTIPADSDKPWREQEWYEPRDLAQERETLRQSTRVRIGVPPFERYVHSEAALDYVTGQRKREIEQTLAKMRQMESKLTKVVDDKAKRFNNRRGETNKLLHDYRGQLLYALLQTGDPAALNTIAGEINTQVGRRQYVAIELMDYLYRALYDGYLLLYDARALGALRSSLTATARTAATPEVYMLGGDPPPSWAQPKHHNFADLAFHMVQVLDNPAQLEQFRYAATADAPPAPPGRPKDPAAPDQLTTRRVRQAIDAAIAHIYNPSQDNAFFSPQRQQRSASSLYALSRYNRNSPEYQAHINATGNQALVAWALLACGESYQNPHLYRRVSNVLAAGTPYLFDRSMRVQMLANLSADRWQPWYDRDYKWLAAAYNADPAGALALEYGPQGPTDTFSNASALYGTLALWSIERSGRSVPDKVWQVIDAHWRADQHAADAADRAGWSVGLTHGEHKLAASSANRYALEVQAPMTAAGAAALSLTERYLYAQQLGDPGAAEKLPHLPRAIAWLDGNFKLDGKSPGVNWYLYLWNLQRVAHANGIRTLNGVDLFRDVTADLLNRQRADGTWEDSTFTSTDDRRWSRVVSTAYALLYLADAVDSSIAVSKLRFDGRWNNRPHDLWNFVERASDEYEARTGWQIVDLSLPTASLLDSPLLYLATDDAFELSPADVDRLRAYLDAGGMLLLNPDKTDAKVARSFDGLIAALYPDAVVTDVPSDHAFYTLHTAARGNLPLKMVHNGVRPVVVRFMRDLGRDLQTKPLGDGPAFDLMNNIYLYAVGMGAQRTRLDNQRLVRGSNAATRSVEVAQLRPVVEPGAMDQLRALAGNAHALDVRVATVPASELKDQRVAFLSVPAGYELPDADAAAIRAWLSKPGTTLWLDAAGGSAAAIEAMNAALGKIEPGARPTPLPFDSPILTGAGLAGGYDNSRVRYRYSLMAKMGASNAPRLQAVSVAGRDGAVIVSAEDVAAGLAGLTHWDIDGYEPESARRLVVNGLLHATGK